MFKQKTISNYEKARYKAMNVVHANLELANVECLLLNKILKEKLMISALRYLSDYLPGSEHIQ